MKVVLQTLAVAAPCHPIYTRCGVPLESEVGLAKCIWVVDVVHERRELQLPISYCCLTYPRERILHAIPALSPEHVLLSRIPFGQTPSLPPLRHLSVARLSARRSALGCIRRFRLRARVGSTIARGRPTSGFVRGLHRYYGPVRLPATVHRRRMSLDFSTRTGAPSAPANRRISRFPHEVRPCMHRVSDRAGSNGVSRYRRHRCCLPPLLTASAPRRNILSRLNTQPTRPPANASRPWLPSGLAHDSGLSWLAKPSTQMTFTSNTSPV